MDDFIKRPLYSVIMIWKTFEGTGGDVGGGGGPGMEE